jgi:hypothetical protein
MDAMEGQSALVAMRRRGCIPGVGVLIIVGRRPLGPRIDEEIDGSLHTMRVDPRWSVDSLDLRCLIGLKVLVTDDFGEPDERTVRAVCAACVEAGAKDVVGIAGGRDRLDLIPPSDYVFDYKRGA